MTGEEHIKLAELTGSIRLYNYAVLFSATVAAIKTIVTLEK